MLLTETVFLNVSLIIFFAAAKYLGGLGVVIGILSLSILILEKAPDKFQGKENKSKLKLFYQFMIITPIILLVYGIYKTIRSYILQQNVNNLFDIALFLFGIISLIVTMYIIPIYKDNYESVVITTTADMLRSMVQDTREH